MHGKLSALINKYCIFILYIEVTEHLCILRH